MMRLAIYLPFFLAMTGFASLASNTFAEGTAASSSAPMPLVLCLAPNGAITGAFTKQFTQDAVDKALVTPAMTAYMKALQDDKIVVVHVKPAANASLPRR